MRAAARLDPLSGRARHVAIDGRAAWARVTGYGRRNAAEWTFSRLKRVLGEAAVAEPWRPAREAAIAMRALNRMAEFGMPRAPRVT